MSEQEPRTVYTADMLLHGTEVRWHKIAVWYDSNTTADVTADDARRALLDQLEHTHLSDGRYRVTVRPVLGQPQLVRDPIRVEAEFTRQTPLLSPEAYRAEYMRALERKHHEPADRQHDQPDA